MTHTIRIGMGLAPNDPYWVQVREAARQRAQECGVILVSVAVPDGAPDSDRLLGFFEDLDAQELGALIMHGLSSRLPLAIAERGLPLVIADDTNLDHPLIVGPTGMYDAACLAAHYICERLEGPAHVLLVGGLQHQLNTTRERIRGFRETLDGYPDVSVTHIPTHWRYEEVVEQLLEEAAAWQAHFAGQTVAAIFGLSDSLALAARDIGNQLGFVNDSTLIVGINGDPLAVAAIIDGGMHATVDTSPTQLGRDLIDYGVMAARGKPLPRRFRYTLELVTAENAPQVAARKLVEIADLPSRLVDVNRRQEQQRLVQLQTSIEINRRVGSILDSDKLLHELAEIIRTRYAYDRSELYQWCEDEQCLRRHRLIAADAGSSAGDVGHFLLAESGALGQALLGNHPIYIPDMRFSTRFPPENHWPDTQSRVILPVRVGGKAIGVLDLHSNRKTLHTSVELDALQSLADQLGVAIQNARLYAAAVTAKIDAERADHLKTRLLANASHELRTPLNIILGYSAAALAEPSPYGAEMPEELRGDLRHIYQSGSHLVRLVDDLLSLSLAEIGALETVAQEVDSRALLTEVFDAMAGSRRTSDVAWRLEVPDILPALSADPVRLRQVLLNLLANAAEHTSSGHVVLHAAAQEGCLDIWIEDTGHGIDSEYREQLSAYLSESADEEPDLDRQRFGVGLGLTVAYHIIRLHGGRLQLQSRPGHGTIAHIQLPLQSVHPVAREMTGPVLAASGPEAQERVLHNILEHASDLPRQVAQHITEHFATQISRQELAQATQVSADYLSRVFRKETGMTPWQFLNRYRVLQAQKLLLSSQHTVTEIAAMVGFNDTAYFVRVFHRETGKAPQQYRKCAK